MKLSEAGRCQARKPHSLAEVDCTGPQGHTGPHGLWLEEGFIIAPWEGAISETPEPCDVACDSCGAPMRVHRDGEAVTLACTACDQSHTFIGDMHYQAKVNIPPSKPAPQYELDTVLPQRLKEFTWVLDAQLAVGLIDQQQRNAHLADGEKVLDARRQEVLATIAPQSWWRRIQRLLGGQEAV
jgi:hypothetical protein